ncbi:MAG: hypothetical protein HY689_09880 [Chloroflexi bacterium]|nr:hypothetical protein [Chloroflexota bacterium]
MKRRQQPEPAPSLEPRRDCPHAPRLCDPRNLLRQDTPPDVAAAQEEARAWHERAGWWPGVIRGRWW